ncbi:MAG: ABC transporter ATP-binding protein [Acidimicrobiia bacterium]|nr:ABC transporter ATP-binding protein [Acidimicrobiia bacterium]
MEPVLTCEGLIRRFGSRTAVDGVDLRVEKGETYGLLGPNGAGKTTTISMVAGILEPDAGSIVIAGRPMSTGPSPAKRLVGLVPQDIALYPDLSAEENLRFFGRLQGLRGRHLDARVHAVLELVGLSDRSRDRIDAYSGGMKRRVNIAAGLIHEPALLILDEPTVGVDPQSRNQILESIEALGGAGLSVLYTTHYMEEAERLCRRVGIIDDGRLVAEGTRRELVAMVGEHDRVVVSAEGDLDSLARAVKGLPGALDLVRGPDPEHFEVTTASAPGLLAAIVAAAPGAGASVTGLEVREPDLEAVFLHLTGKALRD